MLPLGQVKVVLVGRVASCSWRARFRAFLRILPARRGGLLSVGEPWIHKILARRFFSKAGARSEVEGAVASFALHTSSGLPLLGEGVVGAFLTTELVGPSEEDIDVSLAWLPLALLVEVGEFGVGGLKGHPLTPKRLPLLVQVLLADT